MKSLIKAHWDSILIVCYCIKLIALGAGLPDALIILGFLGLLGYKQHLASKIVPDASAELRAEVADIKSEISKLSLSGAFGFAKRK